MIFQGDDSPFVRPPSHYVRHSIPHSSCSLVHIGQAAASQLATVQEVVLQVGDDRQGKRGSEETGKEGEALGV